MNEGITVVYKETQEMICHVQVGIVKDRVRMTLPSHYAADYIEWNYDQAQAMAEKLLRLSNEVKS